MRYGWLISVGISLLGCKDDRPATPAPPATPPSAPGTPKVAPAPALPEPTRVGAISAPAADRPRLSEEFSAETEDKAWADSTEKSIKAVAPQLTDVTCHQTQCQATMSAASTDELARLTDTIQEPDALPSTDAKSVLLTAPMTDGAGKTTMTIYIRYDR